jgi:aspartyl/glutamyl-tRNA(Asn/Gln) amidotransferase C subunit
LTDQEVTMLVEQLPTIVNYVSQLQKIDTTAIAEIIRTPTALRHDVVATSPVVQAILDQAPEREGSNWKVDAVFS